MAGRIGYDQDPPAHGESFRKRPATPPPGSSPGYPRWRCKNSCGDSDDGFPEDTKNDRCPFCGSPIVRWLAYEQKAKTGVREHRSPEAFDPT